MLFLLDWTCCSCCSLSVLVLFSLKLFTTIETSDGADVLVLVVVNDTDTDSSSMLDPTISSNCGDDKIGGIGVAGLRVNSLSAFQTLGGDVINHGGFGLNVVVDKDAK